MERGIRENTPIFTKKELQFKRGILPTIAERRSNRILQRRFVNKLLFLRLVRVIYIAAVINSLPKPLIVEAKEILC